MNAPAFDGVIVGGGSAGCVVVLPRLVFAADQKAKRVQPRQGFAASVLGALLDIPAKLRHRVID
jgi:hypothetical protein